MARRDCKKTNNEIIHLGGSSVKALTKVKKTVLTYLLPILCKYLLFKVYYAEDSGLGVGKDLNRMSYSSITGNNREI